MQERRIKALKDLARTSGVATTRESLFQFDRKVNKEFLSNIDENSNVFSQSDQHDYINEYSRLVYRRSKYKKRDIKEA